MNNPKQGAAQSRASSNAGRSSQTQPKARRARRGPTPSLRLGFLGAAEEVTGSENLIEFECGRKVTRILLDVGLNQGNEAVNHQSRLPEGITADMIDHVLITHAHIDHSGAFPRFVKDGYKGVAITHPASKALMRKLLADSGKLQTMAAERTNRKIREDAEAAGLTEEEIADQLVEPLYTEEEGIASLDQVRTIQYNRPMEIAPGITVVYRDAGHILGSATVTITFQRDNWRRVVCFTGNVGRPNQQILRDLKRVPFADYLISESTYGDLLHERRNPLDVLADYLNEAYERGGKILIPAFSVDRAPAVLNHIRVLMETGRIPLMDVFLDSPLAIAALKIYQRHSYLFNPAMRAMIALGKDPFSPPQFKICRGFRDSKDLLKPQDRPVIIIGSSGMATGGSIRKHIERGLPNAQNTVLFVGHQEPGTLGYTLVNEQPETVSMSNKDVPVRATVRSMSDYSAHADYEELIDWMRGFKSAPRKTFLVHGDAEVLPVFAGHINDALGWDNIVVPTHGQVFNLK